jgi:hypothetical protein
MKKMIKKYKATQSTEIEAALLTKDNYEEVIEWIGEWNGVTGRPMFNEHNFYGEFVKGFQGLDYYVNPDKWMVLTEGNYVIKYPNGKIKNVGQEWFSKNWEEKE